MDSEVSSMYQASKAAVVKVHSLRNVSIGALSIGPTHWVGTGFLIDGRGHLLTVASFVQDAQNCWISWNGQSIPAKILGADPDTNLAVLQVDSEKCAGAGHETPYLTKGNSDDVKIGSMVVAIGFPYNLPSAPSVGFVSGLDVHCGTHAFMTSHFRMGCKLLPGQSGGPLLNARGEVVGVAVGMAGYDRSYALPINAARKAVDDILQYGRVQHGWVGLSVAERQIATNSPSAGERQVFVQDVYSNTPAADAGFRLQDILLTVGTNAVHHSADVLNRMFLCRWGEGITFTVLRDMQTQEVAVVVGKRPSAEILALQTLPLPDIQPGLAPTGTARRLPIVPVSGPPR